jgi:DNA polymerase V
MDIVAKHVNPDADGVCIAQLDEMSYRRLLWDHRPLTDFWQIGRGISGRLEKNGMYTMGDVARMSVYNEDFLYKLFGINAEILMDHAWGYEPCTIADIKAYRPETNSISSGQVLSCPYDFAKARIVVQEMTDQMVLDLVASGMVTDSLTLTVGYDSSSLDSGEYAGPVKQDWYGRIVPKPAHGTANVGERTSSTAKIMDAVLGLYDSIVSPQLLVKRITLAANKIVPRTTQYEQLDLFTDPVAQEKEEKMQEVMLSIKKKFGKNAILKGTNLEQGATMKDRNNQIGGHRA